MLSIKKMDVGPIVGHADMDHVRLWGRASYEKLATGEPRRAFGIARIKKIDSGDYGSPLYFKMNPNFDMSGVAIFCGLQPDTKYAYQMGWFYSDKELEELNLDLHIDWGNSDIGEFVTSSDNSSDEKQFIFGSCRYLLRLFEGSWFDSRGDKTFRSILRQIDDGDSVDKFLMVGDQIYADDLNFLSPDKQVDEYLSRYRDVFSQKYMKELMSKVSTYMTLDDHEIEDNWPSKAEPRDMMVKYPAAIHSYQIYQMSHSPIIPIDAQCKLQGVPEGFYYCFKDGCSDFFVTDTRTERDLEEREIISEFQMESLLQWLSDESERIKFVVTSVPFFPDLKQQNNDKWSGFLSQRDQIIEHIRKNQIKKVVFLSGDVHCSMAAELDISLAEEESHKIYSVISSSFYWPYPHMKRRKFKMSGFVASENNTSAYKLGEVSDVFSGDNFTRIKASQEALKIFVYERKGNLEHQHKFLF